jgi:1-acyl-sn-glycerol-3-phosphate acyltransferase
MAPANQPTRTAPWPPLCPASDWPHLRSWPLPELSSVADRILLRLLCRIASRQIALIDGWENVLSRQDPFLLVSDHSSRREAVFLPAILMLARGGRAVRFLADWNFRLISGIGYLYAMSDAITLTRKDARPRILNLLRPRYEPKVPPLVEAKSHLMQGGSVGIFPEGTVNVRADRLARGRRGAARLSLETGAPVVPVGIRFARRRGLTGRIDPTSAMSIHFGAAMSPQPHEHGAIPPRAVTAWNTCLMTEIGRLCGKEEHEAPHGHPRHLVGDGLHERASPLD